MEGNKNIREELEIQRMLEFLVAKSRLTHPYKLKELTQSSSWQVRKLVAQHPRSTKTILKILVKDRSKKVSEIALNRLSQQ